VPVPARRHAAHNCKATKHAIVLGVACLLSSVAESGIAQLTGSVSVVSDYRYRGVSLSDNEPAAQFAVTYDHATGWYAGAFVSTVKSPAYDTRGVQAISFAGYAWRMPSGLSLDAGADYSIVTAAPRYDYPEVYAGFAFQNVSGRVYYAPRYFGQSPGAVYGELNLAQPLLENVRVLVHVGALDSAANKYYDNPSGVLIDGAVGIGVDWQGFSLQASWVGVNHSSGAYAVNGIERRRGLVVAVSRSF
jgi:uncharacterized protein (TIGR02001 family)